MTFSEYPLISVIITVYNRQDYLAEAIESVLASTYKNFELIIVDDCSIDESFEIAGRFAACDKRIRVYRNEENLGDYPNRNQAAAYAIGKYIKYVDSDDRIFDWGLDYCVKHMERFPKAALGTLCFKENICEEETDSAQIIEEHFFTNELLNIGPSGTIFKTECFKSIGFFNTEFGIASDVYVNIKLAALYPVVLLPKIFFFYRKHEGQQQHNSRYAYLLNNYLYLQALLQEAILPLSLPKQSLLLKQMKKSFATNIIKTALLRLHWKQALVVSSKANFTVRDMIQSIF